MLTGEERSLDEREKSGYLRWDLKFLLGEVGFSNAEQKKNEFVGQFKWPQDCPFQ